MSTNKSSALTERQLDLITRAHCDTGGLIEPLLALKGGAKLKMIASLAQRGLIAQTDGQWRITSAAVTFIKGEGQPVASDTTRPDDLPGADATMVNQDIANDPEIEAAVTAAEASWQAVQTKTTDRLTKLEASQTREGSKQALVIEMLKRPEGATIAQISEVTGWQKHTIRGTFSGALKKKLGLTIVSEKIAGPTGAPGAGQRLYRITEAVAA